MGAFDNLLLTGGFRWYPDITRYNVRQQPGNVNAGIGCVGQFCFGRVGVMWNNYSQVGVGEYYIGSGMAAGMIFDTPTNTLRLQSLPSGTAGSRLPSTVYDHMVIDGYGNLTFPRGVASLSQPNFKAQVTGAPSITTASGVPYNVLDWDTGSTWYNTSTANYKPQRSGTYRLTAVACFSGTASAGSYIRLQVLKNGVGEQGVEAATVMPAVTAGFLGCENATGLIKLNGSSDTVGAQVDFYGSLSGVAVTRGYFVGERIDN